MFISGIYAFTNLSILSVKNEINTGAVKIELEEYSMDSGKETLFEETNYAGVMPGQIISLIPRISNVGAPCYIRAKVLYSDEGSGLVTVNNLNGVSSDWVNKEGYWYYKPIAKSGEKIDIFKTFTIPTDLPNSYQGKEFQLNVIAEAIQADNFSPDFNSETPWNKVKTEKALDDTYNIDKVQVSKNAKIEYENNAQKYIEVPENFLGNLGYLLPGNIVEQEISLKNTTSDEIEYYVTVNKKSDLSEKQANLLKNLNLVISVDNKMVYEGNLYDGDKISLGKYSAKQTAKAKFTVKVPVEFGNEYSLINTSVNWVFSVNGKDKVIPEKEPEVVPTPQTEDTKIQIALSVFLISALGLIIVLIAEKRMRKTK